MGHQLDQLQPIIVQGFDSTQLMKSVPKATREVVAKIVLTFHGQLQKLRLLFQHLQMFVAGEVGEDTFMGLELQAQQRIRERQMQ